jgi:hypothetical protein
MMRCKPESQPRISLDRKKKQSKLATMKNKIFLVLEQADHDRGGIGAIVAAYFDKEKAEEHVRQYYMFYVQEQEIQ